MKQGTRIVIAASMGLVLAGTPFAAGAQCGGLHRIELDDLDMFPDPAFQGQPISKFRVTLTADGNGECATKITVKDSDQVAGNALKYTLRPGRNVIEVPANRSYRMEGADRCFYVEADIQNSRRRLDEREKFCATMRPVSWTLAERGDRRPRAR